MANRLMTKSEAVNYYNKFGLATFIDTMIEHKVIIQNDPKIETLYSKHFDNTWGTIELKVIDDELELWVGGEHRYDIHLQKV